MMNKKKFIWNWFK